jgi:hypothetical protein
VEIKTSTTDFWSFLPPSVLIVAFPHQKKCDVYVTEDERRDKESNTQKKSQFPQK